MVEGYNPPTKGGIPAGLITMIILIAVMFIMGFVGYTSITGGMTNQAAISNVSASIDAGGTMFNMGAMVIIIFVVATIAGSVYYYVSTPKRYKKASKTLEFFFATTRYFAWGLLSFVIVVVPSYLLYLTIQYAGESGGTGALIDVFKWIGIAVGAYFALAGLGYVVKKKIVDNWRERRKERQEEEIGKGFDKIMS